MGLSVPTRFEDITSDVGTVMALKQAYSNDISKVDVWVGGLAETPGDNSMVGPLFKAIIRRQFLATRSGDRFWYENLHPNGDTEKYFSDSELMVRSVPEFA